jgi:WD40 repeat protein
VATVFALVSLVPGLALLIGAVAVLLSILALIVGWVRRRPGVTRAGSTPLGLSLLTSAGNWVLLLYVVSILGLPAPLVRAYQAWWAPPAPVPAPFEDGPPEPHDDPRFGFNADPVCPPRDDPFEGTVKPHAAPRKSLQVAKGMGLSGVVFSPDGKRAVVLQATGAELWDLDTGRHRAFDRGEVFAFSPNGKWLAVGVHQPGLEVLLYDLDTWECRTTPKYGGWVVPKMQLAFSADGGVLTIADSLGVRRWPTADWQEPPKSIEKLFFQAEALALSTDGSILAVAFDRPADGGETVFVWDTRQGKQKAHLRGNNIHVSGLAVAPDGKTLAIAGWNELTLWDVTTTSEVWTIDRDPFTTVVAFSPDGRLIASTGRECALILSNAATGKTLGTLKRGPHNAGLITAQFTTDGNTLLTATDRGLVEVWTVAELLKQGPAR